MARLLKKCILQHNSAKRSMSLPEPGKSGKWHAEKRMERMMVVSLLLG
jgi:hypothetical protein